jgi:hypothetical protein
VINTAMVIAAMSHSVWCSHVTRAAPSGATPNSPTSFNPSTALRTEMAGVIVPEKQCGAKDAECNGHGAPAWGMLIPERKRHE